MHCILSDDLRPTLARGAVIFRSDVVITKNDAVINKNDVFINKNDAFINKKKRRG